MRSKLSTCRRKARFPSEDDAVAHARSIGLPLRPYRCDRCGLFHVTSRTKGKFMPRSTGIADVGPERDRQARR